MTVGIHGLMVRVGLIIERLRVSVQAGIVGGGSECKALSPTSIPRRGALEQGTEPPTAPRAPQHKWVCNHGVCVCTLMGKFRARIPSMGHHT